MSLALGKNNANQKQPLHLDGSNHLLVNDSVNKAVLDTIATNTANINVNVGDVEINVADLEALQATTNTTLATIVSHTDGLETLQTAMSAKLTDIDNSVIASTNVVSKLNLIETTNNANEVLLTACSAKLTDIDTTSAATAPILRPYLIEGNVNTANIKSGIDSISACCAGSEVQVDVISSALPSGASTLAKQDSLISANHADLVALEASLTSMEAKQDTMIGHNDGVETLLTAIDGRVDGLETLQGTANTHLSEIEGAVETLEGCVGSGKVNVNISSGSSGLPSGASTSANQATLIGHVDNVETKLDTLEATLTAIETDQAAIEVLLTAANVDHAANEVLLTNAEAHLGNIETAVQLLDNAISGNEMQVDVVSSALPSGASTLAKQDTIIGHVDGIEALLGTIDADTGAIKTAVEILDNAISGNEMQVDIVSGNITGFATASNQSTIIGHLDGVEGKLDTLETTLTAIDTVLDTIKVDTEAIETATEKAVNGGTTGEWLSSAEIADDAFGASVLDTSAYKSVRFFGKATADIGFTGFNLLGSQTSSGTYYNLGGSEKITKSTIAIGGTDEYHLFGLVENCPNFIKIYNATGAAKTIELDYIGFCN